MNKKSALLCLAAGSALLLAGCGGKKELMRDYSKYVTVAPYTGQTIDRYISEVTDEDVQSYVEDELSVNATYNEITDRAAEEGDLVTVDYTGTLDGEEFEGGSEEDAQLELGSGEYIDGFEEAFIGMKPGEEKEFDITFPTPYDGELDGKTATFKGTLKSITETVYPEYNDEYVSSFFDYSTVEEYEDAIRAELEETNAADADETAAEEFLATVVQGSTFKGDAPEDLRKACEEARDAENQELMDIFGLSDLSDLYGEDYSPEAELAELVNERLVIYTIAAREKLAISDAEYEATLKEEMADAGGYTSVEEYESEVIGDPDAYKYTLLRSKVLSFLMENNTINDIDADEYYADEDIPDDEEWADEDIEYVDIEDMSEDLYIEDLDTEDLSESADTENTSGDADSADMSADTDAPDETSESETE